jgi:predicted nuclease of restriction endonuclease-like (RecB) superfamily
VAERTEIEKRGDQIIGGTGYAELLDEIRRQVRGARVKAARAVNAALIGTYWRIGRMILDRQRAEGWGAKVIDQLAADLKGEDTKGFSVRNLKYMRTFAQEWPDLDPDDGAFGQQAVAQIPWSHNLVLMRKLADEEDRRWYAERTASEGWSRTVLEHQIATRLRERQGIGASNFPQTITGPESDLAKELLTDPLDLSFVPGKSVSSERGLEQALLDEIEQFMMALGGGELTFAGRQKPLDLEGDEFFPDLLFFNVGLLRWIVVELKVGRFEPEFVGKLNFYVNAVDGEIRKPGHSPTVGILLCTERNRQVVEYTLAGVVTPIGVNTYELDGKKLEKELPAELRGRLPAPEELRAGLERIVDKRGDEFGAAAEETRRRDHS